MGKNTLTIKKNNGYQPSWKSRKLNDKKKKNESTGPFKGLQRIKKTATKTVDYKLKTFSRWHGSLWGQGLLCPSQLMRPSALGCVMSRLGGQPHAQRPVLSSQASLVFILMRGE